MLKSLKSLKAMKLKQINADADTSCRPVGLLDGGATHGLRMAYASEINQLEQVDVELASGTSIFVPTSSTENTVEQDANRANCAFASLCSHGL